MVPVRVRWACLKSCRFRANTLAALVIPELSCSACLFLTDAVALVLGPSEASGALLGLASALALSNVEDLVVTANLGSALAFV